MKKTPNMAVAVRGSGWSCNGKKILNFRSQTNLEQKTAEKIKEPYT